MCGHKTSCATNSNNLISHLDASKQAQCESATFEGSYNQSLNGLEQKNTSTISASPFFMRSANIRHRIRHASRICRYNLSSSTRICSTGSHFATFHSKVDHGVSCSRAALALRLNPSPLPVSSPRYTSLDTAIRPFSSPSDDKKSGDNDFASKSFQEWNKVKFLLFIASAYISCVLIHTVIERFLNSKSITHHDEITCRLSNPMLRMENYQKSKIQLITFVTTSNMTSSVLRPSIQYLTHTQKHN